MRSLPTVFGLTHGDGKQTLGDLIVTLGVLYYFPSAYVKPKSSGGETAVSVALYFAGHAFLPGIGQYAHLAPELFRRAGVLGRRSTLRRERLIRDGDSSLTLQSRLDDEIERRKESSRKSAFVSRLPLPTRLTPGELKTIRLTWQGEVRILTTYFDYRFGVGLHRKAKLGRALTEAGFLPLAPK